MEAESIVEQEFYVNAIANPLASDKLNRKLLRFTKKSKWKAWSLPDNTNRSRTQIVETWREGSHEGD